MQAGMTPAPGSIRPLADSPIKEQGLLHPLRMAQIGCWYWRLRRLALPLVNPDVINRHRLSILLYAPSSTHYC